MNEIGRFIEGIFISHIPQLKQFVVDELLEDVVDLVLSECGQLTKEGKKQLIDKLKQKIGIEDGTTK